MYVANDREISSFQTSKCFKYNVVAFDLLSLIVPDDGYTSNVLCALCFYFNPFHNSFLVERLYRFSMPTRGTF